ncbi:tubby C-terminal-like domain-containing protein [Rhizoctonia solani]|nr:tubby C-terminal-like domain-containing protein [Rhizoctonia solani]
MGSSGSTIEFSPLVAQNPPLGVMPAYAQNYELTLKLREKRMSLSGDSFEITDPQGRPYFKMEGSALSFREKKTLKQADGRPIFNIQNKLLTIHRRYLVYNANESTESEPLFTIKSHFALTGAKIDVEFTNAVDGRQVMFDLRGSFFDRSAEVTANGQPVARISRQFLNSGELLFDQQTYYLTVAPGVDAAMMVALCVCMDEARNENS